MEQTHPKQSEKNSQLKIVELTETKLQMTT